MASVTRESIGNLHDKITVKLEKQDYLPSFEKDIRSYSKKANIPGFRKGMVPAGMIKKMYGRELYSDAVIKSAENELRDYLIKEQMDIFGQPLFLNDGNNLPELDVQDPTDYEFLFEVGLRPEINIEISPEASAIFYKVTVRQEDIEQRIEAFRSQYGELKDAESVEGAENIIYFDIHETDENGQLKEGGFSNNTSLYVNAFSEDFQKQLLGRKKDDVLTGQLNKIIDPEKYKQVYNDLNIAPDDTGKTGVFVQIKITGVHTLDKAGLNEELYKKVFPDKEISTEDEFKKAIEEDEQSYWDKTANNYLEHTLHHILTDIPVSLPEDFLKKIMSNSDESPLSEEEKEGRFPSFVNQLKWTLISDKIIKDQELKVTMDEIREEIKSELKQYFGSLNLADSEDNEWLDSYVDRVMADQKQTEQRIDKLIVKKIMDWARTRVSVQEKAVSQEDFKKILEDHQHHH